MDSKSTKAGIEGGISEDVLNEELASKVTDFYNDVRKVWNKYSFLLEHLDEIAVMGDKIQEEYNEAVSILFEFPYIDEETDWEALKH